MKMSETFPIVEVFITFMKPGVLEEYFYPHLLPSLYYFHPEFLSLSTPHKLLSTAGFKSYEVVKARVQLQFLSGQYPSAKFARHWSLNNPRGYCTFPNCWNTETLESPEHILLFN